MQDEPRLRSLEATADGGLRMNFAPGPMLQLWGAEMKKLLEQHDAPNYVECRFVDMETGQPWILLVQKGDGISPGDKATLESCKVRRYRAALEEVIANEEAYNRGDALSAYIAKNALGIPV